MDEFFVVHVSNVGEASGIGEYEGKQLNLQVGDKPFPPRGRDAAGAAVKSNESQGPTTEACRRFHRVDSCDVLM